jgi:hypothetical protein
MAIFPEYAMPKYKSPIRITKPYQKPNYLADAIIGGMGAYTNIQGMNLKKQMFAAQMAQQQAAIAKQQTTDDAIRAMFTNNQPFTTPGGTPAGPINIPPLPGAMGPQPPEMFYEGYQGDHLNTQPTTVTTDPSMMLAEAMQAFPTADPRQLLGIAGQMKSLNPTVDPYKGRMQELNEIAKMLSITSKKNKIQSGVQTGETNYLARIDDYIKNMHQFGDWDTATGSGGPDLVGAESLTAHGMTVANPAFAKARSELLNLYRRLKALGIGDIEIDNIAKQYLERMPRPKTRGGFKGLEYISQGANVGEIAELIAKHGQ